MALSPEQIEKLKSIAKESTNELARKTAKDKLKAEGIDLDAKLAKKKAEPKEKKFTFKGKAKAVIKPIGEQGKGKGHPTSKSYYDCAELVKEAKERVERSKKAAEARANAPKKTEATKVKDAIIKVETKVENKYDKMSKAEIAKLIAETKNLLKALEDALKKAK